MVADKYTIQAETLMKAGIEDYEEILKEVKSADANLSTLRGLRINVQGKPRRLVDVGDIKKTENEDLIQILVFNTDHIPLLTEKIDEVEFNYEVDGQFINIDLPDPTYKQLMEVVDDLNRKKNSGLARLTKAKSEATTRARTALENDFITQGVANAVSRKCSEMHEEYSGRVNELTSDKIKEILGEEFYEKYKSEELDLD
ncbi:MAG: ribosome recycling factor [Alphaproteobacteria bacterium]|tara:strand:- start:46 stop:645 length:600 start_codon:yes stop_codon:yes gene_type:complete